MKKTANSSPMSRARMSPSRRSRSFIRSATTFYRGGYLKETQREELIARGAVGDVLFHPFNVNGEVVDHPINSLVMSVDVERLRKAPIRILTSGGPEKTEALIGAMKLLSPTVLITDEESARKMIEHRNGRPL